MLTRGKADRRSPFHTPTIATVDEHGCPQLRTIVLRVAQQKDARLRFHTDRRSRKIQEIQAQPCVSLHFYDKKAKIQLRATGQAIAHVDGAEKEAAWAASREMSRECYRIDKAPGTFVDNSDDWVIPAEPDDPEQGRDNFVPVDIKLNSIEWLYLARGGHRRALFHTDSNGALADALWMVP